jgi:hypothetical protein
MASSTISDTARKEIVSLVAKSIDPSDYLGNEIYNKIDDLVAKTSREVKRPNLTAFYQDFYADIIEQFNVDHYIIQEKVNKLWDELDDHSHTMSVTLIFLSMVAWPGELDRDAIPAYLSHYEYKYISEMVNAYKKDGGARDYSRDLIDLRQRSDDYYNRDAKRKEERVITDFLHNGLF